MDATTRTARETDYTAGAHPCDQYRPEPSRQKHVTACRQHEPDPATFTREADCPDPGPEAVMRIIRDPGHDRADLFENSDYPVLAACHACGEILRAESFLRPFTPALPAAITRLAS